MGQTVDCSTCCNLKENQMEFSHDLYGSVPKSPFDKKSTFFGDKTKGIKKKISPEMAIVKVQATIRAYL